MLHVISIVDVNVMTTITFVMFSVTMLALKVPMDFWQNPPKLQSYIINFSIVSF